MIFLLPLPLPQGTFCFFQSLLLSEMLSKAAIKTGRGSIEEKEIEKNGELPRRLKMKRLHAQISRVFVSG